jgi:hypothetical protein
MENSGNIIKRKRREKEQAIEKINPLSVVGVYDL